MASALNILPVSFDYVTDQIRRKFIFHVSLRKNENDSGGIFLGQLLPGFYPDDDDHVFRICLQPLRGPINV